MVAPDLLKVCSSMPGMLTYFYSEIAAVKNKRNGWKAKLGEKSKLQKAMQYECNINVYQCKIF